MKVKDVMSHFVQTCTPEANLATVAMMMWDNDCGVVPVVKSDGKVTGMITDRDICMAVATKHREASDIKVGEVFSGKLYACAPDDDIKDALRIMGHGKVRRLPVINVFGALEGILSMNDVVLHVEEAKGKKGMGLTYEEVLRMLKAICGHREPRSVPDRIAVSAGLRGGLHEASR